MTSEASHRASFFRQSGWLMIANIAGGVLMWAVHFLNARIRTGEYGNFVGLLGVIMLLPVMPLQMILAQQTAKSLANHTEAELSGVIRMVWLITTALCLAAAGVVLVLQDTILQQWHMTSPVALWLTLACVLLSLWMPMLWGILQGQQNFLWLGWSMMSNGIGRLTIAALAVLVLGAGAAGMIAGVLLGLVAAMVIAAWQTRSIWRLAPQRFDWRGFLAQILPLLLAFGGFQILFTADILVIKSYFSKTDADYYGAAGTLSRALMWLVLPLAAVMFPRLVRSAARAEKSNLLGLVLLGTGILAVLGAAGLSIVGPFVVPRIYPKEGYATAVMAILPWYAGAMVPLSLGNVLLNHLLARPASKLWLALAVFGLALSYLVAMVQFHHSLVQVLQLMGLFNLLLLGICAAFTWLARAESNLPR